MGFLVNAGNFSAPQAASFSSNGFCLVLRVEPELQRFFFFPLQCSHASLSFEPSHDAWPQSGVLLHALAPPPGVDCYHSYIIVSRDLYDHL